MPRGSSQSAKGSSKRHRVSLAGGVVVLATLLVAVGVALAQDSGGESTTAQTPGPVAAVSPELKDLLSVFRWEQTTADQLPGDPMELLRESGDARPGENPELARRVELVTGVGFVWPMDDGVCYSSPVGGDGCVPLSLVRERGIVLSTGGVVGGPTTRVSGLARDGIASASILMAGFRAVPVVIRDNAFEVVVTGQPTEVVWTDTRGEHSEPVIVPRPEDLETEQLVKPE
jgi:hypothetical protein